MLSPSPLCFIKMEAITIGRDLPSCCTIANLFLCMLHNFLDLEECHLSSLSCLLAMCAGSHSAWWLDITHAASQGEHFHTGQTPAPLPSGAPLSEGTVCLLFTMCVRGWWGMRDSWRVTGRQPAHPLVSVTWSPMPDWPWGERTPPPGSQEKCSYKLKKHEEAYDGLRTLLWLKKKKKKKEVRFYLDCEILYGATEACILSTY